MCQSYCVLLQTDYLIPKCKTDFCFAFAALLHWYIVHRAGGEWSCNDFIQLSHALLTIAVGSFLVHFNAFLCLLFWLFSLSIKQSAPLVCLRKIPGPTSFPQLHVWFYILCNVKSTAEPPQSGGNSYFLWEKKEEDVCSGGGWGKKYFKINAFVLVFLSSDSMCLGMSGNVISCQDQNNP